MIWLEIHCDQRIEGRSKNLLRASCWSDNNDNPAEGAVNASAIPRVLRMIEADAKKQGWVKKAGSWTCPGCKRRTPNE